MKQEKRRNKNVLTYYALCLGDSLELECKFPDHSFKKVVHHGDALVIDQQVQQMSVGVCKVLARRDSNQLLMREGALLLQVEKE